jgi:hypothetical protein
MILVAHICSFSWSLRLAPDAPRRRATLYIDSASSQTAAGHFCGGRVTERKLSAPNCTWRRVFRLR